MSEPYKVVGEAGSHCIGPDVCRNCHLAWRGCPNVELSQEEIEEIKLKLKLKPKRERRTENMRIGIYCPKQLGIPLRWVPNLFGEILNELGYDVHYEYRAPQCSSDDITFMWCFYNHGFEEAGDWRLVKELSKCAVWVNTEQIALGLRSLELAKPFIDVVVDLFLEHRETEMDYELGLPVFSMPFGYHPSMTFKNLEFFEHPEINYKWDVFLMEYPKTKPHYGDYNRDRLHKVLEDNHIKVFDGLPIYHPKQIAVYAKYARVCLCTHAALGQMIPPIKVIGQYIANGGFVLHQKPKIVHPYLEDWKHIVYFDEDDMIEKIHYFISRQDEARGIAKQAFEFVSTKLLWKDLIKNTMTELEKFLEMRN